MITGWQRATHRILEAVDDELADLRLSAAETNALACFVDAEERTVGELVEATAQRPSTVTGVLDRLEARGLIERRPNPADRRSTLIALTRDGRAHARRVATAFSRVEQRIARELPDGTPGLGEVARAVERALGG